MEVSFEKLTSVCRGCLAIERRIVSAKRFKAAFKDVTGIVITPSDGLPQSLCYECTALLRKCVWFRSKVIKSHNLLYQYVHESIPWDTENEEIGSPYLSQSNIVFYEVCGAQTGQFEEHSTAATEDIGKPKAKSVDDIEEIFYDHEDNITEEEYRTNTHKKCTVSSNHEEQTEQRQVTEDEYHDDQVVSDSKCSIRKLRSRRKRFQQEGENKKNYERNEKRQILGNDSVKPKFKRRREIKPNKENYQQHPADEECNDKNTGKCLGKRIWNRRNACLYCQKVVTNFSRHLLTHHANENEVLKYLSINDDDPKIRKQKRQAITDKLRNRGNFIHNTKVSFDSQNTESSLLPNKRNKQGISNPSNYAICKNCFGTFKRITFYKHFKYCNASNDKYEPPTLKRRTLHNHSIPILNTENALDELKDNILSHINSDEFSLDIKNDPLIVAYGSRLLKMKKGRANQKGICSKIRDLETLLHLMRRKDLTIKNLTDAMEVEKYETLIDSIRSMSGFDENTGTVKKTRTPSRMRSSILGCIDILYAKFIESTESTEHTEAQTKKLDNFKRLIEMDWQSKFSSNVEKSI